MIGFVVLAQAMDYPLQIPYRPFRMHPELFDGQDFLAQLATTTAMQIAIEVVTDTACLMFEHHKGYDVLDVWNSLSKTAMLPYVVFACAFGSIGGTYRSLLSDNFTKCNHQDFCFCIDNGLLYGGLREMYCLIIYPNSSGLPPGNMTM
jgi:hypothetical protein